MRAFGSNQGVPHEIFSLRNLLGIGAIYGATVYARKHGGAKQAFNELLGKVRDAAAQRDQSLDESRSGADLGEREFAGATERVVDAGGDVGGGYGGMPSGSGGGISRG